MAAVLFDGMRALLAVTAVAAAVLAVAMWGNTLVAADPRIHVNAPPFVGTWRLQAPGLRHTPALGLAIALVSLGSVVARRMAWPLLLAASSAAALAWSVALAVSGGWSRIAEPLTSRYEYLAAVDRVGSPGRFLATYVDRLASYPTHVKGHPPGMVLVFWLADRIGLGGSAWAAALVLVVAAAGIAAVLVAVRDVAGDELARSLAPFLVLSPAAVWIATSADALFAGVGAGAVCLGVLATAPGRRGRKATALAVASGMLFAALALLSYGLVLLGAIPVAVAVWRRRIGLVAVIGIVAVALLVATSITGFWWLDGLAATRGEQLAGVSPRRPFRYFVVANLAALVVAVGPAAVAGLAQIRRSHPALLLAGGAAVAVAVADLSGFAKGEVERIWLPFVPWLAVTALGLRRTRPWLVANAATGIGLQVMLQGPW